MTAIDRNRFRISEEAALWLVRLQEENSEQLQVEFAAWSRLSPQHIEEFLFANATFRHLEQMDPERRIDLGALEQEAAIDSVVPFSELAPGPTVRATNVPAAITSGMGASKANALAVSVPRRRRWRQAIAASIVALCGLGLYLFLSAGHTKLYATAKGDQMTVKLPDGSVLYLNTNSRAQVSFDERSRNVELLAGEALFVVENDARRPFRVRAEGAAIQALGTQFNVYQRGDGTHVSVVSGAVRIAPESGTGGTLDLTAGNEANVVSGKVIRAGKPNIQRAVAWRARRLMFQADALEDVAREFNRYESRRPIRIEGTDIRKRTVSGVFDADDPRPLIEFLKMDPELHVTQTDQELVIRGK